MRHFSPYEQNQLRKYGISQEKALTYGDMPVEYITGHCEFYGSDFVVNRSALIPRIETEKIVDIALEYISAFPSALSPQPLALSDLGTGCGILGITLYRELTDYRLRATAYLSDISADALRVAKNNSDRLVEKIYYNNSGRNDYNGNSRVTILQSDLFLNYPKWLKFDLVVANLPYIPSDRISKLPVSVRYFEPYLALDGGFDGLELINKCIHQIPTRLKPHGIAILEIDEAHTITDFQGISHVDLKIQKDQFDKNRYLILSLR